MSSVNSFSSLLPNFKQSYSGKKNMSDYKPKGKLGSGERFAHLKNMLAHKPGIQDPAALAAAIGRKKFGQKKMTQLSQHGKNKGK
jgi:hypothetical protein